MKSTVQFYRRAEGFTLIELLVVIAIIGALAAMLIPVGVHVKIRANLKQAQTQMENISTWIENYKGKRGHYPPDNPNDSGPTALPSLPARPQLLYELTGAELKPAGYQTTRGPVFTQAQLVTAFGPGVTSIANSTANRPGDNPDEVIRMQNFAPNVDANSIAALGVVGVPFPVEVLASKTRGPMGLTNVWHYTVGRPDAHNPQSFDLWLDVILGGHTNRICNWSTKPIKL